jgi:hypothetical protein
LLNLNVVHSIETNTQETDVPRLSNREIQQTISMNIICAT